MGGTSVALHPVDFAEFLRHALRVVSQQVRVQAVPVDQLHERVDTVVGLVEHQFLAVEDAQPFSRVFSGQLALWQAWIVDFSRINRIDYICWSYYLYLAIILNLG